MTKEIYLNSRKALIAEAQQLIDKGDIKAYTEKENAIKQLDDDFEAQSTAQANLNAINGITESKAAEFYSGTNGGTDYDSFEYRKAFMNYVTKGTPIPTQYVNAVTETSDVSPVIPTTTLNRIVEELETESELLTLVTRTSYKGGLTIPTSDVKPTASWVAEGAGSALQKSGVNGTITFAYHKLRVAVAMTLEVETMSLSAFESKFVRDVARAMNKALTAAIVSGNGTGKPKGILAETPVSGQALQLASGTTLSYQTLVDMESALPTAYENGAYYFMTKKTFMQFVGMTDDNGQPIARVNYGIGGKPERVLLGRGVKLLDDYMSSYAATQSADTIIAFIFRPEDYTLNTNLNITVKTYEDNDTDDKITKAVMLVDGKVVDKHSLVTLTQKA
jgi:Predicted phage phi-C31 gp36 major capsid-like protein